MKPYRPRVYLTQPIDVDNLDEVVALYKKLSQELAEVTTVEGLQEWLDHSDEADLALSEESCRRRIALDCHVNDPEKKKAYQHLSQEIRPKLAPLEDAMNKQLAAHPCFDQLPPYYDVFRRDVHTSIDLFKEKNIARGTELDELNQTYDEIIGRQAIEFDGKSQPLATARKVLEELDRSRRQAVFEKITARRMEDRDAINEVFDRELALRQQIAEECGFDNYRDYIFKAKDRAYTPDDCFAFHKAIEEHVVPLLRLIQEARLKDLREKGQLGPDEKLRPWDLAVDPDMKEPLRPFHGGQDLFDKIEKVFASLDPRFTESLRLMRENGTFDLENRPNKRAGGYHMFLPESAVPFILMNASGTQQEGGTLIHENGHATHGVQARDQRLAAYRHAPTEMAELASMSAELLTAPAMTQIYSPEDAARVRREQLEEIVRTLPSVAVVDAFQHWLYTNPGHTHEQREKEFLSLQKRFGGDVDHSGFEEARAYGWQGVLHYFHHPFYYIDYGVAQIGALQVEQNFKKDPKAALDAYFHGLKQGGSKPLAELYQDAGVKLDLTAGMIVPLMDGIRKELGYPPRREVPVPRQSLSRDLGFERPKNLQENEPQPEKIAE